MTTNNQKAAKLLEMLQSTQKAGVEELSLITPGVNAFLQASRKMTTALVDNVKDFKAIGQEKNQVVDDILNFKVVSRGATADNLKLFAASGTFTVYAQQYNRKKMPLVTLAPVMEMMIMLHRHINDDQLEALEDNSTEDLVRVFQFYMVEEIKRYEASHVMDYDFDQLWKDAGLARNRLFKNPLYYHAQWMVFFNNEFSTIAPLLDDYDRALDFYTRMANVDSKVAVADSKTRSLVEVSGKIQMAAGESIQVDQQINLLKDVAEQTGDSSNKDLYEEAQQINADKLIADIEQEGPKIKKTKRPSTDKLCIRLSKVEIPEDAAAPAPQKRRVKKVAKKAATPPAPPRGKGAYYAAKGGFYATKGKRAHSDSETESQSSASPPPSPAVVKKRRKVVDSDDEDDAMELANELSYLDDMDVDALR